MPGRRTLAQRGRQAAIGMLVSASLIAPLPAVAGAAAPAAVTATGTTACTTAAEPAGAAVALYGAGTEVVRTEKIAGMRTALVLEPRIAPGTRRRMLRTDTGWCDAAAGFNKAWKGAADGAATAAAYASVAAAPYFDGVTVRSSRLRPDGAYLLRTHARTNGIGARWLVVTDGSGVVSATWTATGFAQKPFTGEIEGLTALPGGTETYTRLADGLLASKRGLPTAESARRDAEREPSVPYIYTGPDGMKIHLSISESRVAADPDVQTGQTQADTLANFADAIAINYQEFHDWGLRKGWESDLDPVLGSNVGWVYINNSLSLYCQACVFIANDFQIHMISELNAFVTALGFTGYKNEREAILLVTGHEMFHNFQNAYNNPGPLGRSAGRGSSTAYSEGTARMQETLHSYSDVTFADKTLVTGGQANPPGLSLDANHCDGYGSSEAALADGPFTKTYNACFFWIPWFNQNGNDALVRLVSEAIPANSTKGNQEEGVLAIGAAAPGVPVADQLAHFAQSSLTGRSKNITSTSGGVERDWSQFVTLKWNPATLEPGTDAARRVGPGGVFGRRLEGPAHVMLGGDGLALYVIRADAATTTTTAVPAAGAEVAAPLPGESVWVVAVNPTVAAVDATISAH